MAEDKALTYMTYLKVDELLALQQPKSSPLEHDEILFIVIHQVYELWFKQVLHELSAMQTAFARDDVPALLHTSKRILTIMKTLVAQIDVVETMTPMSFSSFRDRLESSSGFQSLQFRLLEAHLGKRDTKALARASVSAEGLAALEAVYEQPSLYDGFLRWLAGQGFEIPQALLSRSFSEPHAEDATVRRALVAIYRGHPIQTQVAERLVDLDEGLQEWRYRHVKMVERTIGFKPGTGGSAGAAYLRSTLFTPLFKDLWSIRAEL